MPISDRFHAFARRVSEASGRPLVFFLALGGVLLWVAVGPFVGFSDTYQLVINTATTIVTFLMVFLIQNTQSRDAKAIHLKLDELLRGVKGARTSLVDLEELTEAELDELQEEFRRLQRKYRKGERAAAAKRELGEGWSDGKH